MTQSTPAPPNGKCQFAASAPATPQFRKQHPAIDALPFWREADASPSTQGYHYNHNAKTYMEVGEALGKAMVGLEAKE
ncbi:MAG: hypothetical protein ABI614_00470 [Planctomycetota bacterium]